MKPTLLLPLLLATLPLAPHLQAEEKTEQTPAERKGDKEWGAILEQLEASSRPEATASPEEIEAWKQKESERIFKIAEDLRKFYTTFPDYPDLREPRSMEINLLIAAGRLGGEKGIEKTKTTLDSRLKDEGLNDNDRFNYESSRMMVDADTPEKLGEVARKLAKQFPEHPGVPQFLMAAAHRSDAETAKELLKLVVANKSTSNEMRSMAEGMLKSLDLVGKPLELKFTSLDGREVDLAKLKGKVVLIDFWATWCEPCLVELPKVKAAYEKFKDQGFEIIGISLDQNKEDLERFIKAEGLAWPQYFDGKGFETELARRFAITGIPTVWLVDREGILRDQNARSNMAEKIENLLKEKK